MSDVHSGRGGWAKGCSAATRLSPFLEPNRIGVAGGAWGFVGVLLLVVAEEREAAGWREYGREERARGGRHTSASDFSLARWRRQMKQKETDTCPAGIIAIGRRAAATSRSRPDPPSPPPPFVRVDPAIVL